MKSKHIVIGLAAGLILFLHCRTGNEGYSYDYSGATTPRATSTNPSHLTFDSECNYSTTSTGAHNPTNPQRHEILQTKVKGYRESTYWGSELSTHEKIRQMDDAEFDRFIEKVELSDSDVYWGAEY